MAMVPSLEADSTATPTFVASRGGAQAMNPRFIVCSSGEAC
jgi:hypothetical protein